MSKPRSTILEDFIGSETESPHAKRSHTGKLFDCSKPFVKAAARKRSGLPMPEGESDLTLSGLQGCDKTKAKLTGISNLVSTLQNCSSLMKVPMPHIDVEEEVATFKKIIDIKKQTLNDSENVGNHLKQIKLLTKSKRDLVRSKAALILGISRTSQEYKYDDKTDASTNETHTPSAQSYSTMIPGLYTRKRTSYDYEVANPFEGRHHHHHHGHHHNIHHNHSHDHTHNGHDLPARTGLSASDSNAPDRISSDVIERNNSTAEEMIGRAGGAVLSSEECNSEALDQPSPPVIVLNSIDENAIGVEILSPSACDSADNNYFGECARVGFFSLFHEVSRTANSTLVTSMQGEATITKTSLGGSQVISSPLVVGGTGSNMVRRGSKTAFDRRRSPGMSGMRPHSPYSPCGYSLPSPTNATSPGRSTGDFTTQHVGGSQVGPRSSSSGRSESNPTPASVHATGGTKAGFTSSRKLSRSLSLQVTQAAGEDSGPDSLASPRHRFLLRLIEDSLLTPLPIIIRHKEDDVHLNLSHRSLRDDYVACLSDVLGDLPLISTMDVRDNCLTEVGMTAVLQAIYHQPSLTAVDLSENVLVLESAKVLADYLKQPDCSLRILRLSKNRISDEIIQPIMGAIIVNDSLKTLDLGHNLLGGANEMLIHTDVRRGDMDRSVGGYVANALSSNGCMENLELQWNNIGAASISRIGRSLHTNQCLCTLNLAYNPVKNEGATVIGFALAENDSLTSLDLSHCAVGPRGCFMLAAGLRRNRGIKLLNLAGNPLGEVGGMHMMTSLNYYSGIREIAMHSCNFDIKDTAAGDTSDPLLFLAGQHHLNLVAPFHRFIFDEFVRICSTKRGCQLRNIKYRCPPRDGVRMPHIEVSLVRPRNPAEVMGQPYGPWTEAGPRYGHPYTSTKANKWERAVEGLTLVDRVTNKPWEMPDDGKLEFDFHFVPRSATPIEALNASGLTRLIELLKAHPGEESHILRLCQGLVMESHQLEEIVNRTNSQLSYNKPLIMEIMCALLPCVRDTSNTERLLRRLQLHGDEDMKALQSTMRSMFFVSLNAFTGFYSLDLSNRYDRMAAMRLAEISAEENAYIRYYRMKPLEHGLTDSFYSRGLRDKAGGVLTFDFVGARSTLGTSLYIGTALREKQNENRRNTPSGPESSVYTDFRKNADDSLDRKNWLMPDDAAVESVDHLRKMIEWTAPHLMLHLKTESFAHMFRELKNGLSAFYIGDTINRYVGQLSVRVINSGGPSDEITKPNDSNGVGAVGEVSLAPRDTKTANKERPAKPGISAPTAPRQAEARTIPDETPAAAWTSATHLDILCVYSKQSDNKVKTLGILPSEVSKEEERFDPSVFTALQAREKRRQLDIAQTYEASRAQYELSMVAEEASGTKSRDGSASFDHGASRSGSAVFRDSASSSGNAPRKESLVRPGGRPSLSALVPPMLFRPSVLDRRSKVLKPPEPPVVSSDPANLFRAVDRLVSPHHCYILSGNILAHDSTLITRLHCRVWGDDDEVRERALNFVCKVRLASMPHADLVDHAPNVYQLFQCVGARRDHVNVVRLEQEDTRVDDFSNLLGASSCFTTNVISYRAIVSIGGLPQLNQRLIETEVSAASITSVLDFPTTQRAVSARESMFGAALHPLYVVWRGGASKTSALTTVSGPRMATPTAKSAPQGVHSRDAKDVDEAPRRRSSKKMDKAEVEPCAQVIAETTSDGEAIRSPLGSFANSSSLSKDPEYWQHRLLMLRIALSSQWISTAQAVTLITEFPPPRQSTDLRAATGLAADEKYREHAAVFLFSRIVDLENVDAIVSVLPAESRSRLMNRLGWLNALNTLKFDGLYDLDLSIPDNRMMAVMLTDFTVREPGNNFRDPKFSRKFTYPFIPGWELPAPWDEDNYKGNLPPGVPPMGHLVVTFATLPEPGGGVLNVRLRNKWQSACMLLALPRGDGADTHLQDGPEDDWDDVRACLH